MNHFFRRLLPLLLLLTASNLCSAQYSISGLIRDSIGEPEGFATVRLFLATDTVKPIKASLSDEAGKFNIKMSSPGKYRVNILAFGKLPVNKDVALTASSPTADLGTITTTTAENMLQEVVVTAQKPLVTKEIDRIGYDVQADPDAKTNQLDEMLKRVPLVSVDADGTIKVKGSTDFKIYKNGRPNNSFTRNAKEIFKSIPASMIKKIIDDKLFAGIIGE